MPLTVLELIHGSSQKQSTQWIHQATKGKARDFAEAAKEFIRVEPTWERSLQISTRALIGEFQFGDLFVRITPRHGNHDTFRLLCWLLDFDSRLFDRVLGADGNHQWTILQALSAGYVHGLERILRTDLHRDYLASTASLQLLRGTPLFANLGTSPSHHGIPCRFHHLTRNTLPNRLLSAAAMVAMRHLRETEFEARARSVAYRMAEIAAEARPSSPQFSQAQQGLADRYAAYRPALRLARSLLIGGGPISTARGDGMIGWGLNMAELFERAVYKGISRWCQRNNLLAKWQAVERKLIRDAEGAKYRNLRPDIEVRKNGRLLAIVDAKYKGYLSTSEDGSTPLEKVQNADIYQLAFYGQIPSSADEPAKRPQLFIASPSMETASLPNRYKSLLVAERRLELLEVDLERLPEVGEIPIPGMIAAPKAYEGMDEKQPN